MASFSCEVSHGLQAVCTLGFNGQLSEEGRTTSMMFEEMTKATSMTYMAETG